MYICMCVCGPYTCTSCRFPRLRQVQLTVHFIDFSAAVALGVLRDVGLGSPGEKGGGRGWGISGKSGGEGVGVEGEGPGVSSAQPVRLAGGNMRGESG